MIAPRCDDPEHVKEASQRNRCCGFTLVEFVIVFIILAALIALLLPATRTPREASRRTQCKNNLKHIGLALHIYHDVYNSFPPAYTCDASGKPLHSWRTLLLPYLDQVPLYNQIDLSKPWNDPANAEAFKTRISTYACPSSTAPSGQTSYLAVVTSDSVFRPGESLPISKIKDGTSNTLLVMEVPHDQAVHWMSPQDADETTLQSFGPKSKESHTGGRNVLLGDGTVRFLSQTIERSTLNALITARGGDTVGEF